MSAVHTCTCGAAPCDGFGTHLWWPLTITASYDWCGREKKMQRGACDRGVSADELPWSARTHHGTCVYM